ncbi:MAG TPA: TonB-dependent receptor [Allosphingosinicella sp.]|jgi:TonB-dependent receptor|nr:TonB-dependent receptor [Allosphingosinicella sp.]
MRLKTLVLCSSSAAILALAETPALAQSDPATPPDTTAEAQESPADPEAVPAQTEDGVETAAAGDENEIVVTGLRRSLQSAQGLKRNSEQIVDAIVAEDIGKLPDVAVSDTAARIPGIQVERSGGEASRVLLRGLDRFNYTTTYNGREIFTAETRSVALQDFPAGGISAIEAFKTSTANLVEPGIAGLINVRSRRPFDFDGFELAGSVWGVYPNQSRDFEPNAQLLLSNRWDVGGGEVGALINFSYTRLHYRDSIRRHGFFIADLAGGRSPDWPEIRYNEAERWRPSVNGALQWRPSPDLEFYVEGLWQGYRERSTDRMWAQPLWGGASYSNIVNEGGKILSGTVNVPTACCGGNQAWGFQGATKRDTNTYQFAVGGKYDAGALVVSADLARTDSTFDLRTESIDFEINRKNYSVDWFTGTPSGNGPTFHINGLDFADPGIYNYRGFFEDYLTAEGKDWQARLDFDYEPTGIGFLPRLQWGLRYVNRKAGATAGAFYWNLRDRGIPITAVPLDYQMTPVGFRGDKNKPTPVSWLAPTFDSVWSNLTEFRQFNIGLTGAGSVDGPPVDPGRTYDINEKSYAAYAQAGYEIQAGDATIDGSVGLRVVKTDQDISGTTFSVPTVVPVNVSNGYTDWLPNASMRIQFDPKLQLRLAVAKTRTRPTFEQLSPSLTLDGVPGCDRENPADERQDCVRTGRQGNANLRPLKSNNFDASLEYYFSRTGFVAGAVFRRDMRGFVANIASEFPVLDPTTQLPLLITSPVNTRKARIQGFEGQFTTFFDFLPGWLSGFGMQANVTYIDAKADYLIFQPLIRNPADAPAPEFIPNPNHAQRRLRIPDVSRWTYNVVGMYERGGLTLRLAYNMRSRFPEADLAERDNFFTLQGAGHAVSRLDWSSSYAVTDKFTIFFDWTNILGEPFESNIVRVNYPGGQASAPEVFKMLVRNEESVMSGGIRFRF